MKEGGKEGERERMKQARKVNEGGKGNPQLTVLDGYTCEGWFTIYGLRAEEILHHEGP